MVLIIHQYMVFTSKFGTEIELSLEHANQVTGTETQKFKFNRHTKTFS